MPTPRGRRHPISEREFHRWVRMHLPAGRSGLLPIGDDAAALAVGRNRVILLTSDAFVEDVHFRRSSPPRRIGEAVSAVNLSDLAAKGGRPAAILIDLLMPPGTPTDWARSVLLGAEGMAARYGCHVVGGDTKPSATRTVVGFSMGWSSGKSLPTRRGAEPGDVVVTTGPVGFGGAHRSDVNGSLRVRPRIPEGQRLAPLAHAMTDTSDGIAEAAHLIAKGSRRKIVLVAEALPLHPRLRRRGQSMGQRLYAAFYGGDYELFATMDRSRVPRARAALRPLRCPLTVVGRVEKGQGAWLERGGRLQPLPHAGWRHFRNP
jgi:thiamine-monophosphate kinase